MNIFSKSLKVMISLFLIVLILLILLIVWQRDKPGFSQGRGFRLIHDRPDGVYIIKDKQIVVAPTIVDSQRNGNFVSGLRLPIKFLSCDNASYSKIRVLNERRYFVLDVVSGEVFDFDSKESFEKKLLSLGGEVEQLDYSKFDLIWDKYSRLYQADGDISSCKHFPVGTIEHEMSETKIKNAKRTP